MSKLETYILVEPYEGSPEIGTYVRFLNGEYFGGHIGVSKQEADNLWTKFSARRASFSLEEVTKIVNNWSMIELTPKEIEDWVDKNL